MREIPKCEICGTDYYDGGLPLVEMSVDFESIEEHGKCFNCYEEFGDGWADRNF